MFAIFCIEIKDLYWLNHKADDTGDLCLHGQVSVSVGGRVMEYDPTVSAAALYLMRSVYEDHLIGEEYPLLPCCGFSMYEGESAESVIIVGCPNGQDWEVRHEGDTVRLETREGTREALSLAEYRRQVYHFADRVEEFYLKCSPKIPHDEIDAKGYAAFWREWSRLRGRPSPVATGQTGC